MRLRLAIVALLFAADIGAATQSRTMTPGAAGPNRLDVDVPLLAGSAPGFRDLRLFDASDREVAYLSVQPPAREPSWSRATMLAIATTKTTSGFEADLDAIRNVDRLRLNGIHPPYLKHVTLEASGDRAHWTLVADTTVFDLPDQHLRRAEIAFAAGAYRYLRVTWDDRTSARVSSVASVEARLHDAAGAPEPLRAPFPFTRLSSEPGKSRYRIDLPGPHLPIAAIEVHVNGGDVYRSAIVTEPQLLNGAIVPITLGRALLRRAVRDGYAASETAVPIAEPTGREVDLAIDDGANPPLPIAEIVARFAPQPWIYFESADASPLTARYGNERLPAPQYDLEAARPFAGRAPVAVAHWSGARAVTTQQAAIVAPMPAFGPAIDRKSFRVARPLQTAAPGLVVLPLDADVLAISRDLGDVRIIDASARQVPYVVERRDEPLTIRIALPPRTETQTGQSRYHVQLPYDTLPSGTRLVLTTNARVFERTVRLMRRADERRARDEFELARAEWRNASPETAAAPLTFDVPLYGSKSIDLVVSEGDNAPLPIASAELLLPSYALRFNHPGGALTIVYGSNRASAPRYDLALLAPRLLTEPARTIAIAKPVTTATGTSEMNGAKYFWIVIAAAAIVLLALLARLLAPALREETRPLS
ncbi:MAG TPA: DUF3999 family protein [Thermoanaerobaculia bacterium]